MTVCPECKKAVVRREGIGSGRYICGSCGNRFPGKPVEHKRGRKKMTLEQRYWQMGE